MKKFKNVIALFLLAAFLFTACSSNNANKKETSSDSESETNIEEAEDTTEARETEGTTESEANADPYAGLRNYDNEFYHTARDESSFIVIQPTMPQEGFRPVYLTGATTLGISYLNDETSIVVRVVATYYPDDTAESWEAEKLNNLGTNTTHETISYSGVERDAIVNIDSYSRFEFYTIEADQGVYEIHVFLSNYVNRHDEYDRAMVDSFIDAFMDDVVFTHMN